MRLIPMKILENNARRGHGHRWQRPAGKIHWPAMALALALVLGAAGPGLAQAAGRAPGPGTAPDECTGKYFNYMMAQQEEKLGNWQHAADFLQQALVCDPDSSYLHRELAMIHVHQRDYDAALAVLDDLLKQRDDAQAWILYGRIKQRNGDRDAARAAYEKALALDADQKDIYLILGRLYFEDGNYTAAQAIFEQSVSRFPDVFAGHFLLAKTYEALGRFADAVAAYQRSIDLAPEQEDPRYELIRLYEQMDRRDEVASQYRALLDANPHNARAGLGLALLRQRQGDTPEADLLLERFARLSLSDDDVVRTLVRFYLNEQSDPNDARILLDGMHRAAPESDQLNYLAGIVYDRLERYDEAIALFKQVSPDSGFYEDAVVHVGYLYQKRDRTAEAVLFTEEAIRHRPDNPDFRLYLGTFHEELGAFAEAEKALLGGLQLAPDNVKLHFRLGVVYDKWQRKSDSIAQMKRVIELDPKHANALNYLGYTYAEMGIELDRAEKLIQQALALQPDDGYITDSLGWVYFKQGQYRKALAVLERATSLAPEDPVIMEHVADAHQRLGEKQKALEFYRRALERKEKDRQPLIDKIKALGGDAP